MRYSILELTPIEITVNRSYRGVLTEKEMADYIKNMKKPDTERIYVLFTEVPIGMLLKFALRHNIEIESLKEYYEKYIKPLGFKNEYLDKY